MNLFKLLLVSLLITGTLSACKRGYELNENTPVDEELADSIHIGADEGSSWKLLLKEDDTTFTLEKRNDPNDSATEYRLTGSYETLDSGWLKLTSRSTQPSETPSNVFYGVQLSTAAIILSPFTTNSDEWLPLVTIDDCPSLDKRGNAIFLNRPSDATRDDIIWLSSFHYDRSETSAIYDNGLALDETFNPQSALTQNSGSCSNGYVARSAGDHYLGARASLLELDDDTIEDGYTRTLSLPARSISAIADTDSDSYIGLVRKYGLIADSYRAQAECVTGICSIYLERDTGTREDGDWHYTLTLDDSTLNYNDTNGFITAELEDKVNTAAENTRALCMVNTDLNIGSSTTKLIACTAQAPTNPPATIQFLFKVSES